MNHLSNSDARLALTQFFMECESSGSGHWIVNPEDANVEKIFVVNGPQKKSWFVRRMGGFMNMYFAEYIYAWLSKITVAYVGVNWISNSVDIYFAIINDDEISTFGIRFPVMDGVVEKMEGAETLQFAKAPKNLDKTFDGEATGIAVQIRHILEGE